MVAKREIVIWELFDKFNVCIFLNYNSFPFFFIFNNLLLFSPLIDIYFLFWGTEWRMIFYLKKSYKMLIDPLNYVIFLSFWVIFKHFLGQKCCIFSYFLGHRNLPVFINKITVFKFTQNTHQMLFFLIVTSLHHLPLITPHTNIVATNYSMIQI